MTRLPPNGRRRFPTRWTVTLFLVIAAIVCGAIMAWQLANDPPDEPDGSLPGHAVVGTLS